MDASRVWSEGMTLSIHAEVAVAHAPSSELNSRYLERQRHSDYLILVTGSTTWGSTSRIVLWFEIHPLRSKACTDEDLHFLHSTTYRGLLDSSCTPSYSLELGPMPHALVLFLDKQCLDTFRCASYSVPAAADNPIASG